MCDVSVYVCVSVLFWVSALLNACYCWAVSYHLTTSTMALLMMIHCVYDRLALCNSHFSLVACVMRTVCV